MRRIATHTINWEQAIVDTIFAGYAGGDFRYREDLFYDDDGRIVKTVTRLYFPENDGDFGAEHINEYHYDSNGNLIREGITYDNQINPHRTNKVWMFVDKDYSNNNPQPRSTRYNRLGCR